MLRLPVIGKSQQEMQLRTVRDTPATVPSKSKRLFCGEMKPAGMLAPEVQATTITVKRSAGAGGSQWERKISEQCERREVLSTGETPVGPLHRRRTRAR
jgi:hypothetical protein